MAFDEDGFCATAMRLDWAKAEISKRFRYDGRLEEDFKLATGTWVASLRSERIFEHLDAEVRRWLVIAGENGATSPVLGIPDNAERSVRETAR